MNILDPFNEWDAEQNDKPMTHPKIPYREEESRDIQKCLECMGSMADVRRIRRIWKDRRDFEFPGWMSVYDQQFAEWIKQID